MTLRRAADLKEKLEKLRREAERSSWEREKLFQELEEEFDCKSVAEASNLINKLENELKELEEEKDKLLNKFIDKYKELLNGSLPGSV